MTTRVLVALCLLGAVGAATCATSSKLLFLDQATNTLLASLPLPVLPVPMLRTRKLILIVSVHSLPYGVYSPTLSGN